jgi:acetyl-CoA carboxylase carboxyltransferase component
MDLMNSMRRGKELSFAIVTHHEGMRHMEILDSADIVCFVKREGDHGAGSRLGVKNAALVFDTIEKAFDQCGRLMEIIDQEHISNDFTAPKNPPEVPDNPTQPYNMMSVIEGIFDEMSFVELYSGMNDPSSGPNLITGLARLCGHSVGVIADQPLIKGGGADAFGTEKFRLFVEFLNSKGLPIIMLSNSSGFVPGSKQERYRIQAIGAESLDSNILGEVPVVSVTLNQNYGGRLIHAFNKFLRPGIVYIALEKAVMAVIGVDAAFDLLFGRKHDRLIEEGKMDRASLMKKEFYDGYMEKARASNDASETGLIDWTVPDASLLRENVHRGLLLAIERCREAFGRSI